MNKQEQIDRLQFRIERIESHLAEQHKGNNFNLSEKPNSCYDHLLPEGWVFCEEGEHAGWVKVKLIGDEGENELGYFFYGLDCANKPYYRPIRKIQYHVAVHEAVTIEPNPYAVDWSNAPDWADVHAFDYDGIGQWGGFKKYGNDWYIEGLKSPFTLPSNLDWTKSKTVRP